MLHTHSGRHSKIFVVVCVVLVSAIAAIWGLRAWQKSWIMRAGSSVQHEAVQSVLSDAESEFDAFHDEVQRFGEELAGDVRLRTELSNGRIGRTSLMRYLAALPIPQWWSVEVYDAGGQLIAWKGQGFPLGLGKGVRLSGQASYVVQDGSWRRALAVWQPVQGTEGHVGAVRVMRTMERRYPVQNDYLEDYDLRGTWQLNVGLPVEYTWSDEKKPAALVVPLMGLPADTLGYVSAALPSVETVAARAGRRYDHVLAFLALLLLGWLLAMAWNVLRSDPRKLLPLVLMMASLWGTRFALILLDVPGRWQQVKAPLSPLFDASHLHSDWGWGLLDSAADLLLTSAFVLISGLIVLRSLSSRIGWLSWQQVTQRDVRLKFSVRLFLASVASLGLVAALGAVCSHVVVQAAVDLFARDGLLPTPLVQVVFGALLLLTIGTILLVAALFLPVLGTSVEKRAEGGTGEVTAVVVVVGILAATVAIADWQGWVSWPVGGGFIVSAFSVLILSTRQAGKLLAWVTLRRVLPATFTAAILLYPSTLYGLEERRRIHMEHAADALEVEREAGIPELIEAMITGFADAYDSSISLDSVVTSLLEEHIDSLRVDALVLVAEPDGRVLAADYTGAGNRWQRALQGGVFRTMQAAGISAIHERESVRFAGIGKPVTGDSLQMVVAAERRAEFPLAGASPLVRVLTDAESTEAHTGVSMSTFRSGVLVYKIGRYFRQYRLDSRVADEIKTQPSLWRREVQGGRKYDTYYKTMAHSAEVPRILAVRASAPTTFDHLYYLLRLTVAGLMLGILLFAGGLVMRWRKGMLPPQRSHFRDRVLNAFLVVGIIAVGTVGLVGVEVVTEENDRAVQSWLRQHLQSIEATLFQQAAGDEPAYRALERISLDSLAAQTGLDLTLYREAQLVGATRKSLVDERVVDPRLPVEALVALQLDGSDFAFVEHEIGTFGFTAGYKVLLDEAGVLRYVLSVPALPEQERIEEERARTLAYLFGALLFVLVLVMFTASLLASAVARPIGRLRAGLAAVAVGRFEQLPITRSKDEVGELVETFNDMQSQLVESQGRLARQERQLAWREMARQVAHEIRNPLTPMKLSVQHLRRALEEAPERKFRRLFDRVTTTLVEQMDAMARIANEFASFARMPEGSFEKVNLVEIIAEATGLMQEEASDQATIVADLAEDPVLIVADRQELRRIYINLIKNALEAVRGKEDGRIVVTASISQTGEAESTVVDNGPGIRPEVGDRIFEPSFSTKTSGTGLGLAIARRSVQDLGGEIGYRSTIGVGTTFWLRLPTHEPEKSR